MSNRLFALGNQSLVEQILLETPQQEQVPLDADNWFQTMTNTVENFFSLL